MGVKAGLNGEPARLITIRFSHFCEKARWGLTRAGVPYIEDFHSPLFHVRPVRRAGAKRTTPVLVLPDRVLADSTEILKYCDSVGAALYPTEPALRREVADWEDLFDDALGPSVRRLAYFLLFQVPPHFVTTLFRSAAPPDEAKWIGLTTPLVRFLMKKGMKIDAAASERSRAKMEGVLERVETLLADGRRFLVGDRFTAADLTFASLFAPLVAPPEYGAPMPGFMEIPEPFAALRETSLARPAGRYTRRMFREHRNERLSASTPPP